ncbi:MAG: hypothetical protein FWB72_02945 [Firmicutes bacterium]|nr:hypothetical protein [Bacillota bacterium]
MELKENERLDNLGNGYSVIQKIDGYCFTSDSVELAKFVAFKESGGGLKHGDVIIDFCSGSGIVGFMLAGYAKGLSINLKQIVNVELQTEYYARAKRSTEYNKLESLMSNLNLDVKDTESINNALSGSNIATVITCNPPYMPFNNQPINLKQDVAIARHEIAITLECIFASASKLLQTGGRFYLIHKSDRLADIFHYGRIHKLEIKQVKLIRAGLVLVRAIKDAKAGVSVS